MQSLKLFLVFAGISLGIAFNVHAQELTLERAKEDYSYNFGLYKTAHDKYSLERGEYKKFKTLTAKDSARKATLEMLRAREEVMANYLTVIRTKLSQINNLEMSKQSEVLARIDSEVVWYQKQKNNYGTEDELETLVVKADVVPKQYEDITTPLLFEARYLISKGELSSIRQKHTSVLGKLRAKTNEITKNGDKNTKLLERWLNDIEEYLGSSSTYEDLAEKEFSQAVEKLRVKSEVYFSATKNLNTGLSDVAQANNFMLEMTNNVKTAD